MSNLFEFYMNLGGNILDIALLFRIAQTCLKKRIENKHKIIFLCIYFITHIPVNISFPIFTSTFLDLLFLLFVTKPLIKNGFVIFIKYEIYSYASMILCLVLHSLVFNDYGMFSFSSIYEEYKKIIILFLSYVSYILYTNHKISRHLNPRYHIYFDVIIYTICLLLSYSTLYICQKEPDSFTLPVLFSTIILLTILCISLYDQFLLVTEESARYKIQAEINRMQESYARQTKEALKELHSIRHDIKNHLIVIDGYAAQNNFAKIREYISKTSGRFTDIPLIESPSVLVSAILNEKSMLARQKNIACEITCDFTYLRADDFTMTTILGNLLDNALTAAAKCSDGWIHVSLRQADMLLLITVDNSHEESIHEKDGIFRSTKTEQPHLHGIGIRNVQKAVKNLNGQIEISHTQDTFHVEITLPNYI